MPLVFNLKSRLPCAGAAAAALAAIVQAHRFVSDSRDTAAEERLATLDNRMGVWRCRTIYNCTECCPREIEVTRLVGEVKKAVAIGGLELCR